MSTEQPLGKPRVRARLRFVVAPALLVVAAGSALAFQTKPQSPVPAAPPATTKQQLPPGPSFFDSFDRLDTSRWYLSDGWVNGDIQGCTWSKTNISISKGVLQLVLGKANDRLRPYRCAELRTRTVLGYGTYEARIRSAAGSGLNTAMFTYSGPPQTPVHDELDFEFLGRDTGKTQLNYYTNGKGGHESLPQLGFDASAGFHDYAFVWEPTSVRWYIDGHLVRTESGSGLPKTPGNFFLSLWNGTSVVNAWLGPFDVSRTPVLAEVDWAGYTRAGEKCRFPQSITCKLP
jgi:endo-1,3-1,4-beta-glycanase ExoK